MQKRKSIRKPSGYGCSTQHELNKITKTAKCDIDDFRKDMNYVTGKELFLHKQSNLNSSNTDGSFTMADSNSFLCHYEILPIAQENKYLGILFFCGEILLFYHKKHVVCLIGIISSRRF